MFYFFKDEKFFFKDQVIYFVTSRCIVQSKQPTNRLRSLENVIPPVVLRVTAIDQTVSVVYANAFIPTGQKGEIGN